MDNTTNFGFTSEGIYKAGASLFQTCGWHIGWKKRTCKVVAFRITSTQWMIASILQQRTCQTTNRHSYCVVSKGGVQHPRDELGVTQTCTTKQEKNTDSNSCHMTTMWAKEASCDLNNLTSRCKWSPDVWHPLGKCVWITEASFSLFFLLLQASSLYAQSPDSFWCVFEQYFR